MGLPPTYSTTIDRSADFFLVFGKEIEVVHVHSAKHIYNSLLQQMFRLKYELTVVIMPQLKTIWKSSFIVIRCSLWLWRLSSWSLPASSSSESPPWPLTPLQWMQSCLFSLFRWASTSSESRNAEGSDPWWESLSGSLSWIESVSLSFSCSSQREGNCAYWTGRTSNRCGPRVRPRWKPFSPSKAKCTHRLHKLHVVSVAVRSSNRGTEYVTRREERKMYL